MFFKALATRSLFYKSAFIGQLNSYCSELKNLMPVSGMWPIGPLVCIQFAKL